MAAPALQPSSSTDSVVFSPNQSNKQGTGRRSQRYMPEHSLPPACTEKAISEYSITLLDGDALGSIFQWLNIQDVPLIRATCKPFKDALENPSVLKHIFINSGTREHPLRSLVKKWIISHPENRYYLVISYCKLLFPSSERSARHYEDTRVTDDSLIDFYLCAKRQMRFPDTLYENIFLKQHSAHTRTIQDYAFALDLLHKTRDPGRSKIKLSEKDKWVPVSELKINDQYKNVTISDLNCMLFLWNKLQQYPNDRIILGTTLTAQQLSWSLTSNIFEIVDSLSKNDDFTASQYNGILLVASKAPPEQLNQRRIERLSRVLEFLVDTSTWSIDLCFRACAILEQLNQITNVDSLFQRLDKKISIYIERHLGKDLPLLARSYFAICHSQENKNLNISRNQILNQINNLAHSRKHALSFDTSIHNRENYRLFYEIIVSRNSLDLNRKDIETIDKILFGLARVDVHHAFRFKLSLYERECLLNLLLDVKKAKTGLNLDVIFHELACDLYHHMQVSLSDEEELSFFKKYNTIIEIIQPYISPTSQSEDGTTCSCCGHLIEYHDLNGMFASRLETRILSEENCSPIDFINYLDFIYTLPESKFKKPCMNELLIAIKISDHHFQPPDYDRVLEKLSELNREVPDNSERIKSTVDCLNWKRKEAIQEKIKREPENKIKRRIIDINLSQLKLM